MNQRGRKQPRRATTAPAALASFLLFAALLGVTRADASLTKAPDVADLSRPTLALQLPVAASSEPSRFGFAEGVALLNVENELPRFSLFGLETRRFERTYARNNPLKYVDPDGREVFVAVQNVIGNNYHATILMVPRQNQLFAGRGAFVNNYRDGMKFATLGAGPEHNNPLGWGHLISDPNRTRDIDLSIKVEYKKVDLGGRDENQVTADLFAADRAYQDNLNYKAFPGKDTYNSNSYAAGLLQAVGLQPPALDHNVPGYNQPVPAGAFSGNPLESEEGRLKALGLRRDNRGFYEPIQ